jgi:hypothetical protein
MVAVFADKVPLGIELYGAQLKDGLSRGLGATIAFQDMLTRYAEESILELKQSSGRVIDGCRWRQMRRFPEEDRLGELHRIFGHLIE